VGLRVVWMFFFGEEKHLLSLPGIQPTSSFIFHVLWIFTHTVKSMQRAVYRS